MCVISFAGIADLEMPLSMEPVQGTWKIVVWPAEGDLGEEYKTEKTVTVEEYGQSLTRKYSRSGGGCLQEFYPSGKGREGLDPYNVTTWARYFRSRFHFSS